MKTKLIQILGLALAAITPAFASPILQLKSGATTITVADNSALDSSAQVGVVTYNGAVGSWLINISTGIDETVGFSSILDLNSINVSSSSGGTLALYFSDDNITKQGALTAHIGGTTGGTVAYNTYWSPSNLTLDTSNLVTNQLFTNSSVSSFSGSASNGNLFGTYALTQEVIITHRGFGTTSFDAAINVPDNSATALLLGFGLLGFGIINRRKAS